MMYKERDGLERDGLEGWERAEVQRQTEMELEDRYYKSAVDRKFDLWVLTYYSVALIGLLVIIRYTDQL